MQLRNLAGPTRIIPAAPEIMHVTENLMTVAPLELLARFGVQPGDVAWIHGSPECQQHSYAAGIRPTEGVGHDLLLVVPRWATLCPKAHITIENVPGVWDSPRYPEMMEALTANRDVREYMVNAVWYGLPQRRRRVWIVAGPVGQPCIPVPPPTCDLDAPRTWEWAMANPRPVGEVEDGRCWTPTPWQRDILPFVPPERSSIHIADAEMRDWVDQMYPVPTYRNFIRRLRRNAPVPAVLTGVAVDGKLIHCHPWLNRPSTVRECARFQGFPDEFEFPVSLVSIEAAYRGIGNAVPIPMAEAFAKQIMAAIQGGRR